MASSETENAAGSLFQHPATPDVVCAAGSRTARAPHLFAEPLYILNKLA
jgi:hypothetical protein